MWRKGFSGKALLLSAASRVNENRAQNISRALYGAKNEHDSPEKDNGYRVEMWTTLECGRETGAVSEFLSGWRRSLRPRCLSRSWLSPHALRAGATRVSHDLGARKGCFCTVCFSRVEHLGDAASCISLCSMMGGTVRSMVVRQGGGFVHRAIVERKNGYC